MRSVTRIALHFLVLALYNVRSVGGFVVGVPPPPAATSTSVVPQNFQQIQSSPYYESFASNGKALLQQLEESQTLPASIKSSSVYLAAIVPPSKEDVQLLRQAFAEFYGVDRNLDTSYKLLSEVIEKWQGQPGDEVAGLYRVRGDCNMLLSEPKRAYEDYTQAITLLKGPDGSKADPSELPAALLGRGRAIKSLGRKYAIENNLASVAAGDYRDSLALSSREEWDTQEELIEDGATRNPYAAWEWGTVLRWSQDWTAAAKAHQLAADAFDEIGDKARHVISLLDTGVDYAAAESNEKAIQILKAAIKKTTGVESRDVNLLQGVVAKEGEGRIALASILWAANQKSDAETYLGDACVRLDQLQVDAAQRDGSLKKDDSSKNQLVSSKAPLKFSIDDDISSFSREISCYKFKSDSSFLNDKLGWPENLQRKVTKLQTLR